MKKIFIVGHHGQNARGNNEVFHEYDPIHLLQPASQAQHNSDLHQVGPIS